MTTKAAPRSLSGAGREWWIGWSWRLGIVGLGLANLRAWWIATTAGFALPARPGFDFFETYLPAAERWLAGGSFYHPYQLAGPYRIFEQAGSDPILYPPPLVVLLAPFAVLPAVLWVVLPLSMLAYAIWRLRPRWEGLAICALLTIWPGSLAYLAWFGNPTIWLVGFLALAVAGHRWAAPFILVKPTLAPFALFGIRSRSWWAGMTAFVVLSILLLPDWLEYVTVTRNANVAELSYVFWNLPAMLVPLVAYLAQSSTRPYTRVAQVR